MKILELVKNLFRYPVDMEEKIIQHEEKMLKVYTQIIDESYRGFFEKFGFTVDIFLHWDNMLQKTSSKNRIAFCPAYSCSVHCEIKKNGDVVEVPIYDGEVNYYPLWADWGVSGIGFPFNKSPYELIDDVDDIYEDMNELKELLLWQGPI